jgi:hypothetical protein
MSYAEQWPHLAKVTNNLETTHVSYVGNHLEDYSIEVQIDYADYTAFIVEYSDWSDRQDAIQYACDPSYDW